MVSRDNRLMPFYVALASLDPTHQLLLRKASLLQCKSLLANNRSLMCVKCVAHFTQKGPLNDHQRKCEGRICASKQLLVLKTGHYLC